MSELVFENNISAKTETEGGSASNSKLPVDVQSFEVLRNDGYLYIDKTAYIHKLINSGRQFFLSRPRRFGKSLFLSTLQAYWEGKEELFRGLEIDALNASGSKQWEPYPVFYFDFNKDDYNRENALIDVLQEHVSNWEKVYNCRIESDSLSERFRNVIEHAVEQSGKRVVILVDEYDKSLLDINGDNEKQERNKQIFKGFFSTLKSYDKYLEFVFITGITRFSKVSIFSDLNQLHDISMDKEYADICGITGKELEQYCADKVRKLADTQDITIDDCRKKLKSNYDGYHFHALSDGVYNPFSIMNVFKTGEFKEYWFSTGTPTFLIDQLKISNYDVRLFTSKEFYVNPRELMDYMPGSNNPVPLLYQAGYLTIKDYDKNYDMCQLGYPNDEVKYAFLDTLVPLYMDKDRPSGPLDIRGFDIDIETANMESLKNRFTALFARIPYPNDQRMAEWNYQIVVYLVFTLLSKYTQAEVHTNQGRIDCVVETKKYVYIFEFKLNKSSEEALKQIENKGYADIYKADPRQLITVGVSFNSDTRNIDQWDLK